MVKKGTRRRVVLMGAEARDYHAFLCAYRDDPAVEIVAFSATRLSGIAGRFPASLAGPLYAEGIPILNEELLEQLIVQRAVDEVVLCGGELSQAALMNRAARVLATGASFALLGPRRTMLPSARRVIAVSALCANVAAASVAEWIPTCLQETGLRTTVLSKASAGSDCRAATARAESECDVLLWQGEAGDFPFLKPALHIALVDATDPAAPWQGHPGEALLRTADIALVVRAEEIEPARLAALAMSLERLNPAARTVRGAVSAAGVYRELEQPGLRGELQQFVRDVPAARG